MRVRCLARMRTTRRQCMGDLDHAGLHWVWALNRVHEWTDEESMVDALGGIILQLGKAASGSHE